MSSFRSDTDPTCLRAWEQSLPRASAHVRPQTMPPAPFLDPPMHTGRLALESRARRADQSGTRSLQVIQLDARHRCSLEPTSWRFRNGKNREPQTRNRQHVTTQHRSVHEHADAMQSHTDPILYPPLTLALLQPDELLASIKTGHPLGGGGSAFPEHPIRTPPAVACSTTSTADTIVPSLASSTSILAPCNVAPPASAGAAEFSSTGKFILIGSGSATGVTLDSQTRPCESTCRLDALLGACCAQKFPLPGP
jgi:hypothetical protein